MWAIAGTQVMSLRRFPSLVAVCLCALAVGTANGWGQTPAGPPPPLPAPRAEMKFATHFGVPYVRRGGQQLTADWYVPEGLGPYPGVLMVHGGAWVSGSSTHVMFHARYLASRGYSVMAINYRKAPFHKFPAQLDDCRDALRFMRRGQAEYKVDSARIAGWGYSAGGQLVALLGTSDARDGLEGPGAPADGPSTRLQAVVAGGAPVDFSHIPADMGVFSFYLGGSPRERPEAYRQASAITFVTADDPPFLFFHGANDVLVPRDGVDRLIARLKQVGVRADLHVVPTVEHIGAFLAPAPLRRAADFLDETLARPAPPVPHARP